MKKNEYQIPEMKVVKLNSFTHLLAGSGNPDGNGSTSDPNDPDEW